MFLLSMLLVICLSTCHVVKRKAPDGQLYVFSDRQTCEFVQQSQAPCTVSWKLSSYLAKVYKRRNEIIASDIQLYNDAGYDSGCIQALQNMFCSQAVPKCSAVDGASDYGNAQGLCYEVYRVCPQKVVDSFKSNSICQKIKTGKHPISSCVAPSTPVTGACPQPEFKVSINIYLFLYMIF